MTAGGFAARILRRVGPVLPYGLVGLNVSQLIVLAGHTLGLWGAHPMGDLLVAGLLFQGVCFGVCGVVWSRQPQDCQTFRGWLAGQRGAIAMVHVPTDSLRVLAWEQNRAVATMVVRVDDGEQVLVVRQL